MKTLKFFVVAALAALSLAACKKEAAPILTASPSALTIAAEKAPAAKINLEANLEWVLEYSAEWLAADIKKGDANAVISLTAQDNTSKEARKVTLTISAVKANILPVKIEVTQQGLDHSILTITPATLEFAFDAAAEQKLAVVNNDNWSLKSAELPDWLTISAVKGTGNSEISVGVQANKKSVAREFTLEFVGEDGYTKASVLVKQAAAPVDPKIPQGSGTEADPYTIENADQWMTIITDWRDNAGATFAKTANYKAIADIDFNNVALFTPDSLQGSFDGGNHKFYNIKISENSKNAGFFGVVKGTSFKNIIFGSKDGKTYDGVSKISYTGEGGWHYIGAVSRLATNAEGIVNFMNVEIAADSKGKVRGAGLFGHIVGENMVVKNCTNYGNFTSLNADKEVNAEALFGGVVATFEDTGLGLLENCDNYGTIKSADPFTTALAGVAGNSPSQKLFVLKDCDNYGQVDINTTKTPGSYKEGYVGGVVGLLNGNGIAGIVLENCINHADLTVTGITVGNFGGVAGRVPTGDLKNCKNEGKVTFDGNVAGKALLIGGIAGGMYKGGNCINCVNTGAVSSNKNQVNRIGGIIGTVNSNDCVVDGCTNSGKVSVIRSEENGNWQSVGGIVGFQEASTTFALKNSTNTGAVEINVNNSTTHANQICAGGIIGITCKSGTLTSNVNKADVTVKVVGTAIPRVGGIAGWITKSAVSATDNQTSGKVDVMAQVPACTGGAYGLVDFAGFKVTGDSSNAVVTSSDADLANTGSFVGLNYAVMQNVTANGTVQGQPASADNAQGLNSEGTVILK